MNSLIYWMIQVATYIVHKLLTEDEGLKYCCTFAQRFYAIGHALGSMLENPAENPSGRLLKYIIWCYLRLSESPRLTELWCRVYVFIKCCLFTLTLSVYQYGLQCLL